MISKTKLIGCGILIAIAELCFEAEFYVDARTAAVFWTASAIFIIPLLRRLRWSLMAIKTTSDDLPRFEGRWKNLRIDSFTGYVRGSATRSDTSVSGQVHTISGMPSTGGNRVEGSVSSTTTVTDSFRLVDTRTKEESNFRLQDYNVALWENQLVSVAWAFREGEKEGTYFVVVNHTTGDQFFKREDLGKILQPVGGCLSQSILLPNIFLAFNFIVILILAAKAETQLSRFKRSGIQPLVKVLNQRAKELPPLATV